MAIPEGYFYKDGSYWTTTGIGPLAWDGTNMYLMGTSGAGGTEIDYPAGTFASRPTTGFVSGVKYFRRMTDIGPNGGVVMVRTSDMAEWGFDGPSLVYGGIGTDASPLELLTVSGTTAIASAGAKITFPAGLFTVAKNLTIKGNWKNNGGSAAGLNLHFGTLGTASDNAIRSQAATASGNVWNIYNEVMLGLGSTRYGIHSGNPNTASTSNYDERNTNFDTSLVTYMTCAVSSGTNGNTSDVLQLLVWAS